MGSNKKETLIFTSLMCLFMVVFMSFYNVILSSGLSDKLLVHVAAGLLPALVVALFCDIVIVSKIAKGLAFKIVKPSAPMIRKVLTISCFMVCGMVILMSLYGTLAHFGFGNNFFRHYFSTLGLNFICALPLQLLIVGPLTRFLFTRMFPVQTAPQSA
jgi:preprotein translocase subunit SecE